MRVPVEGDEARGVEGVGVESGGLRGRNGRVLGRGHGRRSARGSAAPVAARRISRASSSIERPLRADCMRSFCFTLAFRLRMVRVDDMQNMYALTAMLSM